MVLWYLSIERDDVKREDDDSTHFFTLVSILDYWVHVPPILVRATEKMIECRFLLCFSYLIYDGSFVQVYHWQ